MKKLFLLIAILSVNMAFAQESNNDKKLWASSVLNQKAPELVVEKWISAQPETKGKFVLIDFWATWCGPCRKYIPTLNNFHEKFGDKLAVIGLSDEPAETVEKFENPKIKYSEAIDTKATLKNALQVKGIPHVILISPKGVVIWEGFPLLDNHQLTEDVLKGLMEKYKS
jgi:thiol-disulfide isomerase/thioredoxin